ncbi:MAG: acetate--CoA ligase family protein [Thermoplasmataceae archaeon]
MMLSYEDYPGGVMDEFQAKALLREFRIKTPAGVLVKGNSLPDVISLRYPLVLKAVGHDLLHKSDAGAVVLRINDRMQLETSFSELSSRFPGYNFLVEEMIQGKVEAILGVNNNPTFGHVIMLGAGGILAEIFDDVSFRAIDVSGSDVREMIMETSLGRFVNGFRGIKVNENKLVDTVLSLSLLIHKYGRNIISLDINPLILTDADAFAVDAKIVLSK